MAEQLVVSESMLGDLNATRPWVKFLAILGFIFTGFIVLAGLFMFVGFSAMPMRPGMPAFFGPVFGVLYLLMAVFFYLIPCLYLIRYGNAITRIPANGQAALEDAIKHQKSFWKYLGIFTIIAIVLYVLIIIGGITFAVIYGLGHHP
ncbi:MAG: hypothetical protein ACRETA_08940 [Gammaproteobacteria bacterium]